MNAKEKSALRVAQAAWEQMQTPEERLYLAGIVRAWEQEQLTAVVKIQAPKKRKAA